MDAAMIVVLVLTAGVVALLAWFEINSRRNDARKDLRSSLAEPDLKTWKKTGQSEVESDAAGKKAA
jgi:hypothetical protein